MMNNVMTVQPGMSMGHLFSYLMMKGEEDDYDRCMSSQHERHTRDHSTGAGSVRLPDEHRRCNGRD